MLYLIVLTSEVRESVWDYTPDSGDHKTLLPKSQIENFILSQFFSY